MPSSVILVWLKSMQTSESIDINVETDLSVTLVHCSDKARRLGDSANLSTPSSVTPEPPKLSELRSRNCTTHRRSSSLMDSPVRSIEQTRPASFHAIFSARSFRFATASRSSGDALCGTGETSAVHPAKLFRSTATAMQDEEEPASPIKHIPPIVTFAAGLRCRRLVGRRRGQRSCCQST